MTNAIVTPNLRNCSTVDFPVKIRSRRLSPIVKKVRQGDASEYDKATGIGYAAKEGHLEALKRLVHHGASLRYWGDRALIHAGEPFHVTRNSMKNFVHLKI